jgi:hypothetical protein
LQDEEVLNHAQDAAEREGTEREKLAACWESTYSEVAKGSKFA